MFYLPAPVAIVAQAEPPERRDEIRGNTGTVLGWDEIAPMWRWYTRRMEKQVRCEHKRNLRDADDRCSYCGRRFGGKARVILDHFRPLGNMGTNDLTNLRLACVNCDKHKESLSPEEWARRLERMLQSVRASLATESEVAA